MHNLSPITVKTSSSSLSTDLYRKVPELKLLANIDVKVLMNKDSSSMRVEDWKEIGDVIHKNYEKYNGFVVVHGTDTMVFTAAALSFMLKNLRKPVVLTGSQRPLSEIRSDARRNLINAVDIASKGIVREVVVFFDRALLRGNRAVKVSIDDYCAFDSPNYPWLAEVGLEIKVRSNLLFSSKSSRLRYCHDFDPRVLFIKVFPSIDLTPFIVAIKAKAFRGVIIEAFGAGNLPSGDKSFKELLRSCRESEVPVVIVSQAHQGRVRLDLYEAGAASLKMNAISGNDITSEAAIVKMMKLLGEEVSYESFSRKFLTSISGEIS